MSLKETITEESLIDYQKGTQTRPNIIEETRIDNVRDLESHTVTFDIHRPSKDNSKGGYVIVWKNGIGNGKPVYKKSVKNKGTFTYKIEDSSLEFDRHRYVVGYGPYNGGDPEMIATSFTVFSGHVSSLRNTYCTPLSHGANWVRCEYQLYRNPKGFGKYNTLIQVVQGSEFGSGTPIGSILLDANGPERRVETIPTLRPIIPSKKYYTRIIIYSGFRTVAGYHFVR